MPHGNHVPGASENGFELSLANEQTSHAVDARRLMQAARRVLADSKYETASISLAVVDDRTIHTLNRQFLQHDYPTDVLSFVLDTTDTHLKGEVVLSADTASAVANACGWSAQDEQLLYVIHGVLHLVGLDDQEPAAARQMRAAERYYLHEFGVELPEIDTAEPMATTEDSPGGGGLKAW
ncbi:MAG: rRNA maturation RNase YbeY [Pirellulales bacterium]